MKKARATRDYAKFSDAELLKKSHAVSGGLKGNTAFPYPTPGIDALDSTIQLYEAALTGTKTRDSVKVAEKNAVRITLVAQMDSLLRYVNSTAEGDRPRLLSTGFTISKEYAGKKVLGEIKGFKAEQGRSSGQVKVKVKKVDNAKFYEFQFALSPVKDDVWQHTSTPGCTDTLMGLIRGKEYDIRVCAVGNKGVRAYSDPITILVV